MVTSTSSTSDAVGSGLALTDSIVESLKPALVFKNFVSQKWRQSQTKLSFNLSLCRPATAKRNKLGRHFARWEVPRGWL